MFNCDNVFRRFAKAPVNRRKQNTDLFFMKLVRPGHPHEKMKEDPADDKFCE